jgi:hypothetical protein
MLPFYSCESLFTRMKSKLDEGTVTAIRRMLMEKFGEPIGKAKDIGSGVADERGGHSHRGEDPGNHGWGANLICDQCGGMMGLDEVCSSCGMMDEGAKYDVPWSCKLGHHLWGPAAKFRLRHESKPNIKQPWAHMCDATRKFCKRCGKNGDIISTCKGVISKVDDRPIAGDIKMSDIDVDTNRDYNFGRGLGGMGYSDVHESEGGGRHPGHASSCTCPDCSRPKIDELQESREHVSPQEVLTTWEDLRLNSLRNKRKTDIKGIESGVVTVEELASWLNVAETGVRMAMTKVGLIEDPRGNVVSRGMTPMPFKAAKRA